MEAPSPAALHSSAERAFLLGLQEQALGYFLENQAPHGLVLDRQRNIGPRRRNGLCSTAATGMGLIALALASASPHQLITRADAVRRILRAIESALGHLPHTAGILPHFVDNDTLTARGHDLRSTVDTAWFAAGALWAAEFLRDRELHERAASFYQRIDWRLWSAPDGLLRHGAGRNGRGFRCTWDRLNGETVFMYVLAAGSDPFRAWPAAGWKQLRRMPGTIAGRTFGSADLGLFVFQYGLDLIDLRAWKIPEGFDLWHDAQHAAAANAGVCQAAADRFCTYRQFWGVSAGDGPGSSPRRDVYRCYSPAESLDGTAHVTATIASIEHQPELVWENLGQAETLKAFPLRGRYGFSNLNVDRSWRSRDVVGIDLGAAILALDNILMANRVRRVFHAIPAVGRGLERIVRVAQARSQLALRRAA